MRCKEGDWAQILRCRVPALMDMIGTVVLLGKQSNIEGATDCWDTDPITIDPTDGYRVVWADHDLKPIRDPGDDAVDETLQRLGTPADKAMRELDEALEELKRVSRELKELEKQLT